MSYMQDFYQTVFSYKFTVQLTGKSDMKGCQYYKKYQQVDYMRGFLKKSFTILVFINNHKKLKFLRLEIPSGMLVSWLLLRLLP